jgi:hypothetical protein
MISIKKNDAPKLKRCIMQCDGGLHNKLDNYDLTSFLNTHSTTVFLGKPKSGKTSLLYSFLKSKEVLRNVFDKIFIFQPEASGESLKDNIFKTIPDDQRYEELTIENLLDVKSNLEGNSLLILDDVTVFLKDKKVEKLLKEFAFNRRHLHLSIIFLVQSYVSIPPQIRRMINNLFVFKTSKTEFEKIFEEHIEQDKDLILPLMKIAYTEPHDYLFINTDSQRLFHNWDEIEIE